MQSYIVRIFSFIEEKLNPKHYEREIEDEQFIDDAILSMDLVSSIMDEYFNYIDQERNDGLLEKLKDITNNLASMEKDHLTIGNTVFDEMKELYQKIKGIKDRKENATIRIKENNEKLKELHNSYIKYKEQLEEEEKNWKIPPKIQINLDEQKQIIAGFSKSECELNNLENELKIIQAQNEKYIYNINDLKLLNTNTENDLNEIKKMKNLKVNQIEYNKNLKLLFERTAFLFILLEELSKLAVNFYFNSKQMDVSDFFYYLNTSICFFENLKNNPDASCFKKNINSALKTLRNYHLETETDLIILERISNQLNKNCSKKFGKENDRDSCLENKKGKIVDGFIKEEEEDEDKEEEDEKEEDEDEEDSIKKDNKNNSSNADNKKSLSIQYKTEVIICNSRQVSQETVSNNENGSNFKNDENSEKRI